MKLSEILAKPFKVKGGGTVNLKGLSKHIVDKEISDEKYAAVIQRYKDADYAKNIRLENDKLVCDIYIPDGEFTIDDKFLDLGNSYALSYKSSLSKKIKAGLFDFAYLHYLLDTVKEYDVAYEDFNEGKKIPQKIKFTSTDIVKKCEIMLGGGDSELFVKVIKDKDFIVVGDE